MNRLVQCAGAVAILAASFAPMACSGDGSGEPYLVGLGGETGASGGGRYSGSGLGGALPPGFGGSGPGEGGTPAATGGAGPGTDSPVATGGATESTGGAIESTGGTPASGGTAGDTSGTCSLMLEGATGNEPGGLIPVCCAPDAAQKADIDAVYQLLNAYRQSQGVAPLEYDLGLEAAIQGHCQHMATHEFFDHTAPEEAVSSPWTRAELCGSSASGENIAMQSRGGPEEVMQMWQESDGHNRNMLDDSYTRVGVGNYEGYWGQIFGSPPRGR
jgi:uncharacterized protein YkwD